MNQKWMQRVPQRFAFKKILQHGFSYSAGRFAPPALAIPRHFFFDMRPSENPGAISW
jgi:hypothetical protein